MDKELIMKQSPAAALLQVRYTNYQACCPGWKKEPEFLVDHDATAMIVLDF